MADSARRLIVGLGYVGRRLAQAWVRQGATVFATTRSRARFAEIEGLGAQPIEWNVLGGDASFPEVDAVVYCVGYDRSGGVPMRDVYVDGLRRTLARAPSSAKLLYVSSTGVYGDAAGAWVDEATPPAPSDSSGQACLEAEQLLRAVCADRGIRQAVLRLAGIYGPGRMIGAEGLKAGKPVAGDPSGFLNLIHVEDVVNAIESGRVHASPGETYNICDGSPVRRRDFYQYVSELLQTPPATFDVDAARRHRGDRRVSNAKMLRELGCRLKFPDYRAGLPSCFG